jgi:hypothetical protein
MSEITVFGVLALTFMMAMYSLEGRHRRSHWPLHSAVYCPVHTAS